MATLIEDPTADTTDERVLQAMKISRMLLDIGRLFPGPRIVVHRDEADQKVGNIIIPDSHRALHQKQAGIVVGLGTGLGLENPEYKHFYRVGDRVVFGKYEAMEFRCPLPDGQIYYLCILNEREAYMVDPHPKDALGWISLNRDWHAAAERRGR